MNLNFTRKKMVKKISVLLSSLLVFSFTQAQDFHLTQYDAAALNLNPSMTGMFSGYYRVHAHYRTQWAALATHPFQTMEIAYDMPYKNFSFGGQLMDYTAGTGNYNVFSFEASGAYDKAVDKNGNHHLAGGLQLGLIQKSVNMAKLNFGNQYTYANGGGFDNTLPNGEPVMATSKIIPDVNLGLTYYFSKEDFRINPFIGFSASHITNPNESVFSATDNKLPVKYIIHGGCKVNITETIQLLPKFLVMHQINDKEMTMSLFLNYYLRQQDAFLIFGPTFRLSGPLSKKNATIEQLEKDAAAIELGMKYGRYTYRVSYDINTSSLNPYSNGRGGLELSVTYIGRKQKPNPIINCPRL